jgi:hypothetical protein
MKRDPPSGPAGPAPPDQPPRSDPALPLTPAQRDFARLLGGLLAELWEREHGRPDPPPADRPLRP